MTRFLVLLLVLGVALAGCATPDDAPGAGDPTPATTTPAGAPVSDEEAEDLVRRAAADLPDRYGFRMEATRGGTQLVAAEGTFDNASGASHLTLRGSPLAFGGIRAFAEGASIYTSDEGAVYRFGDLALVQASAPEDLSGLVPATLFTPDAVLEQVRSNLTVTSVRAVDWNGRPALALGFEVHEADAPPMSGTLTLLREDPPRIARVEAQMPQDRSAGPLAGAALTVDLLYGDDAPPVPEDARRLVGLGYDVEASDPGGNQTWTFLGDGRVALDEVEARVQDLAEAGDGPADAPVKLSMPLSEGEAEADGVRVAFDDADGDGALSAGDTLAVTVSPDAAYAPQTLLYDLPAQTYATADFLVVFQTLFRF